ncbi:MAG: pilus assembly protein FimV [Pseudomonadota bacterium]|nr:pilus assembly protein FimV [Pseudomonadota bacterium]
MHFNQRRPIVSSTLKTLVAAVASAVLLSSAAYAAGLGRLTVLSALGQPLRAEIELTSVSSEEANGLVAKLANPDAFRAANIDFNPALLSLRFAVEQRSGRQIVRITSNQPMNEPFVDMLLELSWNNGRLVREYTFLLDPAELRTTQSAQVAPAAGANSAAVRPRAQQPAAASVEPKPTSTPAPVPASSARPARPATAADAPAPAAGGKTLTEYRTRRGDTLGRIAAQNKPVDISLDMMLVALYRANPDAFLGNNMNRLKSGQILSIPDADALKGTGNADAHGVVVAHAADFNAYRNKLAGQVAASAPAKEQEASQSGAGKITAKVQERPTAANEATDKLRLSKAAPGAAGGGKAGGSVEDTIAREKEVAEAAARVKELERNVNDLQKLATIKSKAAADAAAAAAATTAATPVPAVSAPAAPVAEKPVTPAAARVPVPITPIAKKPVPAQAAESSLVDKLMDNITVIGAGLLVLLLALFAVAQRRKKSKEADPGPASLLGAASQPAHSMYDEAGGQSVDTNNSVFNSSFSPSASQLDTNEVDPVAEADVYIAYGRDAQAEEILKEALRTNPERYPVRLKLLEIYAARKDLRSFETQAGELYSMTRGQGEEWQQAASMGLQIDPANPLYGAGEQTLNLGTTAVAGVAGAAAVAAASQSDLAQQLAASFASSGAQPETAHFDLHALESEDLTALPQAAAQSLTDDNALDFDLGGLDFEPAQAATEVSYATPAAEAAFEATVVPDMDFFSKAEIVPVAAAPAPVEAEADPFDIDFDMDFDTPAPATPVSASASASAPAPVTASEPMFDLDVMNFDGSAAAAPAPAPAPITPPVGLTKPSAPELTFAQDDLPSLPPAERTPSAPAFDMSGIDLDLPASAAASAPAPAPAPAPAAGPDDTFGVGYPFDEPAIGDAADASNNSVMSSALMEMETKLDLAIAYQEIGDKEGARELLDEVIKGGNSEQVSKANAMRAQLA